VVRLPAIPSAIAVGKSDLWIATPARSALPIPGQLIDIDLANLRIQRRIPVGGAPTAIALARAGLWIANGRGLEVPSSHGKRGRQVAHVDTLARVVRACSRSR
jgi:hypothetical protein